MAGAAATLYRPHPSGLGALAATPGRGTFGVVLGLVWVFGAIVKWGAAGAIMMLLIWGPMLVLLLWYELSYRTRVTPASICRNGSCTTRPASSCSSSASSPTSRC